MKLNFLEKHYTVEKSSVSIEQQNSNPRTSKVVHAYFPAFRQRILSEKYYYAKSEVH